MSTLQTNPDYSEEGESNPLPLNLYSEFDKDQDLWIKPRLENLVNGTLSAGQLAVEIDAKVTEDTNRQHAELLKQFKEGNEDLDENPYLGHLAPLISAIVQLCFAFPAYHPGQTHIVELLFALKSLPHHEIHAGLSDEPNEPHPTVTLWPFGEEEGNCLGFQNYFNDEIHDSLPPYRLRNLNSAMARLTALNICDCSRDSALPYITPSNREYPDLGKRPIDGPNILGNKLMAAAQWVLTPDEGRFVYQECKKSESDPDAGGIWTMEHWNEWKQQFAFVAGDERFAEKYRHIAENAHRRMLEHEGN